MGSGKGEPCCNNPQTRVIWRRNSVLPWNHSSRDSTSLSTGATRRNYSESVPSCSLATRAFHIRLRMGRNAHPRPRRHRPLRSHSTPPSRQATNSPNQKRRIHLHIPRLRLTGPTRKSTWSSTFRSYSPPTSRAPSSPPWLKPSPHSS